MSDLDLDALQAVAKAATPGHVPTPPRHAINLDGTCDGCAEHRHLVGSYPTEDSEPWLCADCSRAADYDNAFDPPTVLSLIERLRKAEGERDRLASAYATAPSCEHVGTCRGLARAEAAERTAAAQAEVIERLRTLAESKQAEIDRINATPDPLTGRCSTMRAYVLVEDLLPLLAAAPTPPAEEVVDGYKVSLDVETGAIEVTQHPAPPVEDGGTDLLAALQRSIAAAKAHPTPPTTEAEECIAPPGNLCTNTGCWDADRCVVHPTPPTTDAQEATDD